MLWNQEERSQQATQIWGLFAWKPREQLRQVRESMGQGAEALEKAEGKEPVKEAEKV